MTKKRDAQTKTVAVKTNSAPNLNISKFGIVARDYRDVFENGYRDFSYALPDILELLDEKGCDAVLFSLFSIIPRHGYIQSAYFNNLANIKAVFLEEFKDGSEREAERYVVHYRSSAGWKEYCFYQIFATITGMSQSKIKDFVKKEVPNRILGNCCVLICGETNGVKYSKADKRVQDTYGLRDSIPKDVNIILNPIHDRMTRFEMKLKREYLSQNNRLVISVWNKGKQDKNGKVRDGINPPWTIFYNGKEKDVNRISNDLGVEISVFDSKMVGNQ